MAATLLAWRSWLRQVVLDFFLCCIFCTLGRGTSGHSIRPGEESGKRCPSDRGGSLCNCPNRWLLAKRKKPKMGMAACRSPFYRRLALANVFVCDRDKKPGR